MTKEEIVPPLGNRILGEKKIANVWFVKQLY